MCSGGTAKPQFLDEIRKLSTFNDYDEDDITTARDEKRKRDKKAAMEAKKVEEAQRQAEEVRRKQEEADRLFALAMEEEENKMAKKQHTRVSLGRKGLGRGRLLQDLPQMYEPPNAQENKQGPGQTSYFRKEEVLKNKLAEVNGMESYYSNTVQRQYWHPPPPPSEQPDADQGIESNNSSPEFESCPSSTSSPPAFLSAPASPLPPVPVPLSPPPSPPRPRPAAKKRGSRLAAKFSNLATEDKPENGEFYTDAFMLHDPRTAHSSGFRSQTQPRGGVSLNDIRPSHRIVDDGLLRQVDFMHYLNMPADDNFILKQEEFPPLN